MIRFSHKGDFSKVTRFLERAKEVVHLGDLDKYGREGVAALASATPVDSGLTASSWYYEIVNRNGSAKSCASAIRQAPTKRVKPPLHRKAPTVTVPTYEKWRFFRPATPVPTPSGDTPENRSASRSRGQRRYPRRS